MSSLIAFALATCVLLVVPGPAMTYVITRSLQESRRAGLASVLGLHTGTLVYIAAAVTGLTSLLVSSVTMFNLIKYLGAAYLVYLGLRTLLDHSDDPMIETATDPTSGVWRAYRQGALVNVLNPKLGVFFLAFVPQFVTPDAGAAVGQLLVLGGVFVALGVVIDGACALMAASVGDRLRRSARVRQRLKYATGSVYIGLGVLAAVAGPQRASA